MVGYLVKDIEILLTQLKAIEKTSDEIGDAGTNDLITPYIYEYEKDLWMLKAYSA